MLRLMISEINDSFNFFLSFTYHLALVDWTCNSNEATWHYSLAQWLGIKTLIILKSSSAHLAKFLSPYKSLLSMNVYLKTR